MSIEVIKNKLPEWAKDIRLNVVSVLTESGAPDLTMSQVYFIALACAYASKNGVLAEAMLYESQAYLTREDHDAAKAAASIMAMNNIYYRFTHMVHDKRYQHMPVKLRMNRLANPGTHKTTFELGCLAISAINGCGLCMDSHAEVLLNDGITPLAIQSAVRIAAVMYAVSQVLSI